MALNLFDEFEQTSLPLGEKYVYNKQDFIEFGNRLNIKSRIVAKIIDMFEEKETMILAMVDRSFLSDDARELYKSIVAKNYQLFRQSRH
jgi:DNA-binding MarR family transcriptional regulator